MVQLQRPSLPVGSDFGRRSRPWLRERRGAHKRSDVGGKAPQVRTVPKSLPAGKLGSEKTAQAHRKIWAGEEYSSGGATHLLQGQHKNCGSEESLLVPRTGALLELSIK